MMRKTLLSLCALALAGVGMAQLPSMPVLSREKAPQAAAREIVKQETKPARTLRVRRAVEGDLQAALSVQGAESQKTVWSESFDSGLAGWTITQGSENSVTIDTKAYASNPFSNIVEGDVQSLHFDGDYRVYKRDIASITGPAVTVPANGMLHFYVGCSLNMEDMSSLQALVSTDDFATEGTIVWWSRNQQGEKPWQWRAIDVDLAEYVGKTIKIRFTYTYGTNDDIFKSGGYMGEYYVDGVSVTGVDEIDHVDVNTGEVINFVDMSAGAPAKWEWAFPGGTPETSTEAAPAVYYTHDGIYDVTLTVTDAEGNTSSVTREGFVNVTGTAPVAHIIPPATFRYDDTHLPMVAPLVPVQYRDGSAGFPTQWTWNFSGTSEEEMAIEQSTEQNPWVSYDYRHEQAVTLEVANEHGTSSDACNVSVEYYGLISNLLDTDYPTTYSLEGQGTFPGDNKLYKPITAYGERFSKPSRPMLVYGAYVFFETASAEALSDQIASVGVHLTGVDADGMPDMSRKFDSMWWDVFELETSTATTLRGTYFEFNPQVIDEEFYIVVDGIPEHNDSLDVSFATAALREGNNTAYFRNTDGWRPVTGYFAKDKGTSYYIMPNIAHSVITLLPVGTDEVEVDAAAGKLDEPIFSLFGWKLVDIDADWCRITNEPGEYTLDTLNIEYDALPFGIEERVATISLTDGIDTITLRVVQRLGEPALLGDVNLDGVVNATDLSIIVNIIAGIEDDEDYITRADINGDDVVNATDIAALVNIIAGVSDDPEEPTEE